MLLKIKEKLKIRYRIRQVFIFFISCKERILLSFSNLLNNEIGIHYLHISDLLTPIDGKMTAVQYIISSRIIDIRLFRGEEKKYKKVSLENSLFPWAARLSYGNRLCDNIGKDFIQKSDNHFLFDIDCMNKYGYSPVFGYVYCSVNPLTQSGGTHRLAWLYLESKNSFFPVKFSKKNMFYKTPMLPLDGESYMDSLVSDWEKTILEENYKDVLSSVRTYLSGIIINPNENIMEIIKSFGNILDFLEIRIDNSKILKSIKSIIKRKITQDTFYTFHIQLNKQRIYYFKGKIKSMYIDKMNKELKPYLKDKQRFTYICPTVTDSIELDLLLRGNTFD